MRTYILLFVSAILISLSSCRSDFEFSSSTGQLGFSKDTVYLDTVFTNIGSSTYTLKVYNKTDRNISIPTIQLGRGMSSGYRITVDGMTGNNNREFHNVEMLAKDSLFIFIETTADVAQANPDNFLYTDQIQFGETGNFQTVELVTLIQDAVFLFPNRDSDGTVETILLGIDENGQEVRADGFMLDNSELHWTNEKPYVIYGYAAIPTGRTLTIDEGVRVHFHDSSALVAYNGSNLNINGTPSPDAANPVNEVIFEGDRLEPEYSDISGQWLAIWMMAGSRGNFNNLTIKNATIGIFASGYNTSVPYSLNLNNVQVYNSASTGIWGQTAHIRGKNVVINTSGSTSLLCSYGGKYNFVHSTFNNSLNSSSHSALTISNYAQGQTPEVEPIDEATFRNCIVYGSNPTEVILYRNSPTDVFNYSFQNCLLKINPYSSSIANDPLYQNTSAFLNCLIAEDNFTNRPFFWDANNNKLNITTESAAVGQGDAAATNEAPNDILDVLRPTAADLGAYQAFDQPTD
ncbi:hypothetical protein [Flavobacterium silvaticum]|uniref:Right-handed parallel beta-helix repeat-containing protein n=1 Tax=Flavobacterium silvaticum TaxID=1852020 RepID=A0A972FST7_9FLAO|nr:hypothetical protein [Flavobacterium silvaticum]NMH27352.1 hypothetical protein [Flavobacterium silvaticum]